MIGRYNKFIKKIHFTGDMFFLNLAYILGYYIRFDETSLFADPEKLVLLLLLNMAWGITVFLYDIYSIYRTEQINRIISNSLNAIFMHLLFALVFYVFIFKLDPSRRHLIYFFFLFSSYIILWRIVVIQSLKLYRRRGKNFTRLIFVGVDYPSMKIYHFIRSNPSFGYRIIGFFDDTRFTGKNKNPLFKGGFNDIQEFCNEHQVDEIFLSLSNVPEDKVNEIITFADNHLIRIKLIPNFANQIHKKVRIDFYGNVPILILSKEPLQYNTNRIIKRIFDIVVSGLFIVLVYWWLYIIIGILIKKSSPGPILFSQQRTGKGDQVFDCYKFRSMRISDDADTLQATKEDVRITKIGRFIRKTSLDEIPQFVNVFKGDMSIIGPRPHMLKHTEQYAQLIDKYMVRHFVKPGISGWAQVAGYRGETKNIRKMKKRVQYDVWYIENWSFMLDIKIMFLTVWQIFKGDKNAF